MNSEGSSIEAIVLHLRENHLNQDPPRFINGRFIKESTSAPLQVLHKPLRVEVSESLSSVFLKKPNFSIHTFHSAATPIHISYNNHSYTLQPSESVQLAPGWYGIHTEGDIASSCMCIHNQQLLLAIGCIPLGHSLQLPTRSNLQGENARGTSDGVISIYNASDIAPHPLLHILHSHSYPVEMQWIFTEKIRYPHSRGVLSCLFIDGTVELIPVLSHPVLQ